MSTTGANDSIENHGFAIDRQKTRVRCRYCGKLVSGFSHLEHHLGGSANNIAACRYVPANVKSQMRDAVQVREVGVQRSISFPSSERRRCLPRMTQPENSRLGSLTSGTSIRDISHGNADVTYEALNQSSAAIGSSRSGTILNDGSSTASRCVGRFFYEAGVDLNAIELPSFQEMMEAAINCGSSFKVPKFNELSGWILQEELGDVQKRVQDAKQFWGQSGCSILLDVWTDQRGRNLISFLVDCPCDTIFLRSVDASGTIRDSDALVSLLSGAIEEVGVQNVVQVISPDTSCFFEAVGKKLVEKYKTIFWTVCADNCINLILERVEGMEHVKHILDHAKAITKFIYSHALTLELMGKLILGGKLIRTSFLRSAVPFLTWEKMVSEKENLLSMFTSQAWSTSALSSTFEGKLICELVEDSLFWFAAIDTLRITNPLINSLRQINGSDTPQMGFLYDTMDRSKEEMKKNLGDEEATYLPYWTMIDEIWDRYLHSPLHAAAYYLNPGFFYSNDFVVDAEVANGLATCICRMTEDKDQEGAISLQLDDFRGDEGDGRGGFAEEMAIGQRSTVPPVTWWSMHGGQAPELQKLAIKLLSQTCSTAARYKLRRGLSEQLHSQGSNVMERQRLSDMEFVHNNLRLWQSSSSRDPLDNTAVEGRTPPDDWTVEDI